MYKLKKNGILPKIILLTATIIWGLSFVVIKSATENIPPFFIVFIRFSTACLILSLIFIKRLKKIDKKYILYGCISGVCLFLAISFQTFGIKHSSPGKIAFLTATYCVIVPFLHWITDKNKPDIYNICAAFLCIIGIGFISLQNGFSIKFGDSLALLSGLILAIHIVIIDKICKNRDPIVISIIQFGMSGILGLISTLLFEPKVTYISPSNLKELAFLSVCCTAIALMFQNIGQKYTPPSSAALILSLESVFGAIFSIVFGKEVVSFKLIIGFITIFIALMISETKLSFLTKKSTNSGMQNHKKIKE